MGHHSSPLLGHHKDELTFFFSRIGEEKWMPKQRIHGTLTVLR
jgi:hypothetical protein